MNFIKPFGTIVHNPESTPSNTSVVALIKSIIVTIMILLLSITVFIPVPYLTMVVFSIFMVFILVRRDWGLVHFTCCFLLLYVPPDKFLPSFLHGLPAVTFLVPFVVSSMIILPFRPTRQSMRWIRAGELDRNSWLLIVVTGILSTVALITWAIWSDNLGICTQMVQGFKNYNPLLLLGLGLPLFATVNAIAEEVIYRGVMQEALLGLYQQQWLRLVLQSSAFAAVHFQMGFPNGYIGYLMVLVYGVMLGYLRERTHGILAPWLAHVVADLTIGLTLIIYIMP